MPTDQLQMAEPPGLYGVSLAAEAESNEAGEVNLTRISESLEIELLDQRVCAHRILIDPNKLFSSEVTAP